MDKINKKEFDLLKSNIVKKLKTERAILLYEPSCCGKNTLVNQIATSMDFEIKNVRLYECKSTEEPMKRMIKELSYWSNVKLVFTLQKKDEIFNYVKKNQLLGCFQMEKRVSFEFI